MTSVEKYKKFFILCGVLVGFLFFSDSVSGATQACKINSQCYGIGDDVPTLNGIQGVGKITADWLQLYCKPPLEQPFDTIDACKQGGDTYPNGGCKCGTQCIRYGDSAAGGTIVTPGSCGPCTEYPSFQKCLDDVDCETQATGTAALGKYATQLNKLKVTNAQQLIGILIRGAMGVLGTVALVMMIYGGVTYMTARGNSEKTAKGLETILWAGLGVMIIFASYALVNFVFDIFR